MQKPLSRLEKFLYALCSLDSSELPNPLSRLEVLLKCLVTGETPPAFEPLSRNEKYLMTILGSYHDELPNPISRGEKLLYKLATGDDNIDDIGEALSRYEELLTYMIGDGCLDGSIDVEYVTYVLTSGQNTLYNTKELPVKSAFLKGNTLVNLTCHGRQLQGASDVNLTEGRLTWTTNGDWQRVFFVVNGKPNTKYIIKYQSIHENVEIYYRLDTTNINQGGAEGIWMPNQTFTSGNTGTFIVSLERATASSDSWVQDFMIIEYQDGMENWDIPYFEGMQSVKMPVLTTVGKNLFDKTKIIFDKLIDWKTGDISDDPATNITDFIKVIPNTQYTMSFNFETSAWTRAFGFTEPKHDKYATDVNGVSNKCYFDSASKTITFTTSPTTKYLLFSFGKGVEESFQLEQGSTATSYEPYKSNILTVNEDVTLRSNGDVYDELNLLTGRLTQRNDENNEVLTQEVVKTVDLSVVDQDGNNTKLSTFNDITHVTVTSEGLIPEAELEVATKNEEVLNTMSLEMDDISATQTALEKTSNAQSENVDATMMATTEIYEGLL